MTSAPALFCAASLCLDDWRASCVLLRDWSDKEKAFRCVCMCVCTDYKLVGLVRELSDEEDALTGPNKAFLQHALPAVPVLLLGFTALEGRELVRDQHKQPAAHNARMQQSTHGPSTRRMCRQ